MEIEITSEKNKKTLYHWKGWKAIAIFMSWNMLWFIAGLLIGYGIG